MGQTGERGGFYVIRSGRDIHPINSILNIQGVRMLVVTKKVRRDYTEYALQPFIEDLGIRQRIKKWLGRPLWWR